MVQSVARAVDILRALAGAPRGLGVTEVADRLGVAKPTAHALLRTLEQGGLVGQDHVTNKYRLGPALLELGNAYLETHELRARSVVWADSLATRANEAVWVGVLSGDHVIVVHHAFRPEGAVQILEVGAAMPWHTCALGKAIVAHVAPTEREHLLAGELPVLTGETITDPASARRTARPGGRSRVCARGRRGCDRRRRDRCAGVGPRRRRGRDRAGRAGRAPARRRPPGRARGRR